MIELRKKPSDESLSGLIRMIDLSRLKQNPNEDTDKAILNLLDIVGSPVSQETISVILGVPKFKVCKKLNKLEKHNLIHRSTVSKSSYWVRK